jgi:nucleoid DNA-binding protein
MNRLDVIKAVSQVLTSKTEAVMVVETTFNAIAEALKNEEKVVISNFGTFRVKHRKPRSGRNPKTGASVSVPERKSVRFKASRNLLNQ